MNETNIQTKELKNDNTIELIDYNIPKSRNIIKLSFSNHDVSHDLKIYSHLFSHVYFNDSNTLNSPKKDEFSKEEKQFVFNNMKSSLDEISTDFDDNYRPRPSILKQYEDIKLLIKQYYDMILHQMQSSNHDVTSREEKKESVKPMTSIKTVLYLIDSDWINRFVSSINDESNSISLGKVHNSNILKADLALRDNLKEADDYYFIPREVWKALTCWYGVEDIPIAICCELSCNHIIHDIAIKGIEEDILANICISSQFLSKVLPDVILSYNIYTNQLNEEENKKFHNNLKLFNSPKNIKSITSSPVNKTKPIELSSFIYTDVGMLSKSIQGQCFICHDNSKFRCTKCSVVYYCNKICQKIHWKYHKTWCNHAEKYQNLPPFQFQSIVQIGKRGKLGLYNLGNSCYMNSSLQCLSHISQLTNYIISEKYNNDLNIENRDGTGGLLVKEYLNLLKEMWLENKAAVSPAGIKRELGRINRDYAGAQQHDAHEVTMLILDKLHEDLNLVHKKPYTMNPEGDGTNDEEISKEAWEKHLLRENSIIQKLIGGLVRNEINCQSCKKKVIQFDYQQTVQLAIPKSQTRTVYILYVTLTDQPILLSLTIDKLFSFLQLKKLLLKQYENIFKDLDINSFIGFDINKQSLTLLSFLEDNQNMITISNDNFIGLYPLVKKSTTVSNYYIVLYQRMFIQTSEPSKPNIENKFTHEIIGIPMLLSIQLSWTCYRVRIAIVERIERFIDEKSTIGQIYYNLISSIGKLRAQFVVAKYLPIRVVDQRGYGSYIPTISSFDTFEDNSDFEIMRPHTLHDPTNRLYGSILPTDNKLKLAEYLNISNADDIFFLSVDWSHQWLKAINEEEVNMVALSSQSIVSLSTIASNNQHVTTYNNKTYAELSKLLLTSKSNRFSNNASTPTAQTDASITIEQCLNEHTKIELLEKGNEWYCSKCKKHQLATKRVLFWKSILPKILIISLKRFEFREISGIGTDRFGNAPTFREKIEDFVDFPLEGLDLSNYCYNSTNSTGSAVYDLFAVCNHYGRMGFGHYTAFARDYINSSLSSQWYAFDDDSVKRCINPNEVKTRAAYILYYRRRE